MRKDLPLETLLNRPILKSKDQEKFLMLELVPWKTGKINSYNHQNSLKIPKEASMISYLTIPPLLRTLVSERLPIAWMDTLLQVMQLYFVSLLATSEISLDPETTGADCQAMLERDKLKLNFWREESMILKRATSKLNTQVLIMNELLPPLELKMLLLLRNLIDWNLPHQLPTIQPRERMNSKSSLELLMQESKNLNLNSEQLNLNLNNWRILNHQLPHQQLILPAT